MPSIQLTPAVAEAIAIGQDENGFQDAADSAAIAAAGLLGEAGDGEEGEGEGEGSGNAAPSAVAPDSLAADPWAIFAAPAIAAEAATPAAPAATTPAESSADAAPLAAPSDPLVDAGDGWGEASPIGDVPTQAARPSSISPRPVSAATPAPSSPDTDQRPTVSFSVKLDRVIVALHNAREARHEYLALQEKLDAARSHLEGADAALGLAIEAAAQAVNGQNGALAVESAEAAVGVAAAVDVATTGSQGAGATGTPRPQPQPQPQSFPSTPDGWKTLSVDTLALHGVSIRTCKMLAEAGFPTLGGLLTKVDCDGYTGIRGIGRKKAEQIELATVEFWRAHQEYRRIDAATDGAAARDNAESAGGESGAGVAVEVAVAAAEATKRAGAEEEAASACPGPAPLAAQDAIGSESGELDEPDELPPGMRMRAEGTPTEEALPTPAAPAPAFATGSAPPRQVRLLRDLTYSDGDGELISLCSADRQLTAGAVFPIDSWVDEDGMPSKKPTQWPVVAVSADEDESPELFALEPGDYEWAE